ncbi:MAG: replicative DNA helicase, partial [Actinobacteria bacterium]|nr:replicative DNA helicase [Actinomycetota bacterium]
MSESAIRDRALNGVTSVAQVPPHNLEAEQALLGSMFLSHEAAENALSSLGSTEFYRPAHQKIFAAIAHLYNSNVPVDHVSVADRLESTGELEQVGGKTYLIDITQVVPTAANASRYGEIVKRTAMLRALIGAATQIVSMGYQAPDDLDEVIDKAERLIFEVTNERIKSNFKPIDELLEESFKQLEELFERQEKITGVPTGFKDLDELLAGLHRSDLIILAARPAVGKTALALNIAVNAAKSGATVGVFSLEMSA